jgi:NAD-dependent SIR2 family protein deacetylase
MFGEPAPNYRFIQPAIESCDLFVSIGTSGRVVDSVMIADAFTHSILVDPVRQIYVTSFGSHDRYIDEYFETFLQCTAVEAADTLRRRIEAFLTGR